MQGQPWYDWKSVESDVKYQPHISVHSTFVINLILLLVYINVGYIIQTLLYYTNIVILYNIVIDTNVKVSCLSL